jgi:Skp family chaperone for outer membrane proteins
MTRAPLFSLAVCLLAVTLSTLPGCNKDDTSKSDGAGERVGVVNIALIEDKLGWFHQMDAASREYEADLRKQYADLVTRFDTELTDKMKQFGIKDGDKGDKLDKLTPVQRQELSIASTNAQTVRSQGLTTAQNFYNDYRMQLDKNYRAALAPLIEEIAKERKMTVIIAQNDALPYSDPSIDISKAVITAATFKPPTVNKPIPRKLQVKENTSFGAPLGGATSPTTKP